MPPSQLNGIPVANTLRREEIKWFSYLRQAIAETNYGTLSLAIQIKNGRVTMIRQTTEKTVSIENDRII